MLIVNLASARGTRTGALLLLLSGIGYGLINVGVFVAALIIDAYSIFERGYVIAAGLAGPSFVMTVLLLIHGWKRRLNWLALLGFAMAIAAVGLLHLWAIEAASQSV